MTHGRPSGRAGLPRSAAGAGPGGGSGARHRGQVRHARLILAVLVLGLALGALGLAQGARAQDPAPNKEPQFPPRETGSRYVDENTPEGVAIGAPLAATDADGDTLVYAISGGDARFFGFDSSSGQLRTKAALDYEDRIRYRSLTVTVHDGKDSQGDPDTSVDAELKVHVVVFNVDELGTTTLRPARPRVGEVLRSRARDPDGLRYRSWEWSRSSDMSDWTVVQALGHDAEYTPGLSDVGMYLRAVVKYRDGHGGGKSAEVVAGFRVADAATAPELVVTTAVSGLSIPWDVAFTPDGTMLFTERGGKLSARTVGGTARAVTADLDDLRVGGETGLMSIVVDPGFASNRRFYTCQGHTGPEIQVIAWTIDEGYTTATRVADPLVGGILAADHGGHAGCRVRFGPQGLLWISVGDASLAAAPQSVTALAGKVLRVDPATGAGAVGNPYPSSPLVYSRGHRNPQGLALRPGTAQMWSVEHGPGQDDEINLLVSGANYGFDPAVGTTYVEHSVMTDLAKHPDALEAKWSSGIPTVATSGGTFLTGAAWGRWEGWLAVATLADETLRVFDFSDTGDLLSEIVVDALDGQGRLRSPVMGPDGALYVTTSNGAGADEILRVAPRRPLVITGPAAVTHASGGAGPVASYTAVATGVSIDWSLSGADAAAFSLAGGVLRFLAPPNYGAPTDTGADNRYEVTVHATDGLDSRTLDVVVSVAREERPPPPPPTTGDRGGPSEPSPRDAAPAGFVDVAVGGVHSAAVDALFAAGVTEGCGVGPLRFCPDAAVTRAQMASFLARALELRVPRVPAGFVDVAVGGVHSAAVDALFAAGVTEGCGVGPLRFCPDAAVTRAQMASFLARALELRVPRVPAGFVDVAVGGVHSAAVDALFAAGVTEGCGVGPLRFCPDAAVTRAQMASFLARALGLAA